MPKTNQPSAVKLKHRTKIIEYLGDPSNPFEIRQIQIAEIIGIDRHTLLFHFTPGELAEIFQDGLKERRKHYAGDSVKVDAALKKRAEKGDVAAIKLYKQTVEGFGEKTFHEERHVIIAPDIEKGDEEGKPIKDKPKDVKPAVVAPKTTRKRPKKKGAYRKPTQFKYKCKIPGH